MSMPSDVTADVTEALEARETVVPTPVSRPRPNRSLLKDVSPEDAGLMAAAAVAFLGVAVLGPRLAELRRPKRVSLQAKAQSAAKDARRRADAARQAAQKRLRRLGGGTIRR